MKTVLITGASRGLGEALTDIFIDGDMAYNLILHSKSIDINHGDPNVDFIKGDLRLASTIGALSKQAEEKDIDILINNAGIYTKNELMQTEPDKIFEVIQVNLLAPILLTQAVWPIFQKKKSGLIININSMAGKYGSEEESIYCASKHGLRGFSNSLQYEATKYNIRIIDVLLGAMKTDMSERRTFFEKLIDPSDAALAIFRICKDYPSMRITEIDLNRRIY